MWPAITLCQDWHIQNPPVKITGKFWTYQASLVGLVHGEIPLSSLNWKFKVWVTYLKILYGNLTRSILDTGGLFLDLLYSLLSSNQSYGALMKVIIQQIPKSKAIYLWSFLSCWSGFPVILMILEWSTIYKHGKRSPTWPSTYIYYVFLSMHLANS